MSELFAPPPQQQEIPFAVVRGEPYFELPKDLYIPPDALEVILDAFEGPLDLLLYLIRRQNLDILDIPIAEVTRQYIGYIELMREMRFELAAEYLLMAAILAEVKSRLLLPRPAAAEQVEADPRADLVRRLLEYERFKTAAEDLDRLPRLERDTVLASAEMPDRRIIAVPPPVELRELLVALADVLRRAELFGQHHIAREPLSVRHKMSGLLELLEHGRFVEFASLFVPGEGRRGVVVTFLAMLELAKEGLVEIVQEHGCGPIHLRTRCRPDDASATAASPLMPAASALALALPEQPDLLA